VIVCVVFIRTGDSETVQGWNMCAFLQSAYLLCLCGERTRFLT